MNYEIFIHPQAHEEFLAAVAWYEERLPGLGSRFLEKIKQTINQIVNHPEYFGKLQGRFRQAKVETFPYCIVFEFFPLKKIIHISAIFHTRRDPRKKFRRLR
jgi:plasmid stabilization system protein ParE